MLKQDLRKIYKEKRKAISPSQKLKWDDLMLIQFQQFNFLGAENLLTYWPMDNMNEPNTQIFSSYLKHSIPNLQVAYPVSNFVTNTFNAILVNDDTTFVTNAQGITEPTQGNQIEAKDVDIVFVPLLICNTKGYRVGYGKGFYDKFLHNCLKQAVFIGLNYFEPVQQIDDVNEFDIPLNFCVTPQKIYEF